MYAPPTPGKIMHTESLALKMEQLVAQTILQGFDAQYGRFLEVTSGAQSRFEQADWPAVHAAMKKRIHLYDHHVGLVVEQLNWIVGSKCHDAEFLGRVKEIYTRLLTEYPRFEIAESFFNSVYCRLFHHQELTPDKLFIFSSQPETRFREIPRPLSLDFPLSAGVRERLRVILSHTPLRLPWEDLARDIGYIHDHLLQHFGEQALKTGVLQVFKELFFRNKAAWLVGKVRLADGTVHPFLLPIHQNKKHELYIDTCLTEFSEASTVFSFAHSYFMVYAPLPAALVEWLREILPTKTTAELYMAIGCQKHGKTEYHREYLNHVAQSSEQFIIAPGIKGMVMLVFTLPSFNRVFKVIKDRFAPQKEVTAEHVRACYRLVKEHDRVGRMADTQEYENFVIDKHRLSDELLEELRREVPLKLEDLGDKIVISHLYIERRITPLNIYLDNANKTQLRDALEEYGNAIKQMAAANIFPGDMLFKNFGITRQGRVVFYDYDEICYMTEVNFRNIPPPRYPEDELSAEPWYTIASNDVFPEEFRHIICHDNDTFQMFSEMHGDLFETDYWRQLQQRIHNGVFEDVYAYRKKKRFAVRAD